MVKINISLFLILFSTSALGSAYISQFMFGLEPCILCLYQRIPYFFVLLFAGLSLFLKGKMRWFFVAICGICLVAGGAIAFYQVGVENQIFIMEDGCVTTEEQASTLEEMTMQLMGKPNVPCDKPQFVFLGISMAGWNFLFSSAFGFLTLIMSFRSLKTLYYISKSEKYTNEK